MAYTKPTLANLKQSLADRHDSGDLPTESATLSMWLRIFNRAVTYCIERVRMTKSVSLTTASGTIALPDDFAIIDKVVNSGEVELIQIPLADSTEATGLVYWISGDFVSGFFLNTPSDETYTVYYVYRPAPMVNDSDVCPFPDEEAIVAYAYGMLRKSETDPFEDAAQALNECDGRLNEIQQQHRLNEESTTFKMQQNA